VSPEYVPLAGVPIRHGRGLLGHDNASSENVVVISESLRRVAFGESSGVDASLAFNFVAPPFRARVVGVVGDVRHGGPTSKPQAEAYFPLAQTALSGYTLAVRTPLNASALRAAIVAAVERVDRDIAVPDVTSWPDTVDERYRVYYWRAALSALVGATVLLLSSIAIHGAVLRALLERRREFALRTALGASRRSLAIALTWDLARICTGAAALGAGAGFVLLRFASAKLVGLAERPLTFSLAAAAIACLTAAIAAFGPARAVGKQDVAGWLRS
jgi:ABC-type lipoprotein release transport system permease subunit